MTLSFNKSDWEAERYRRQSEQPRDRTRSSQEQPSIVFEDTSLLVVEKPAGMPVQPDQNGSDNLLEWLQSLRPSEQFYLVHRLDRPVFGLLLVAKSARVQTAMNTAMARNQFRKTYRAVVENGPADDTGMLVNWLVKDGQQNFSSVVESQTIGNRAREARLHFQVLERVTVDNKVVCQLAVTLETGRLHQIRVQLSRAGWPILGDPKYNPDSVWGRQNHIALQACKISFLHPDSGERMNFQASAPSEWPWNLFEASRKDL